MFQHIVGCAILVVSLTAVSAGTVAQTTPANTEDNEDTIRQAKAQEMLKYMNASVDPCKDFYEFTCGNWNTYNPATVDQATTGLLETLLTAMDEKIKLILTSENSNETAVDKKVKEFYRSCMNLPSLLNVYPDKLRQIVDEFGEMPVLAGDKWQEDDFDWLATIAAISYKYGFSFIAEILVAIDIADNSMNRLYVTEQELPLKDKSIYLDKDNAKYILAHISNIAERLNSFLQVDAELATKTARELVDFETALAKGTADILANTQYSDIYTLSTLDELQQKYSAQLDILKLVNLTMGTIPTLKVYVNYKYMDNLISVLKQTPKRIVANYIYYQLLFKFMVTVPESEKPLQDTCISEMKTYFFKNFDNMVYRKYNTRETEEGVSQMWQSLKSAFKESLESQQYKWIKEETRRYAVEKLNAMQMVILSYDQYNFSSAFDQFSVDNKDYLANLKSLLGLNAAKKRALIDGPPQPIDFSADISTTPSNILIENTVRVPVVMLQPNYAWSASFPNAYNFGMLGALLAHEVLHGFDNLGRNYDVQGNAHTWWDNDSAKDFDDRANCLNDQYQTFVYKGKHLPHMPSQSENIADNGGVRLAYKAYLNWYKSALNENPKVIAAEMMPGLDFDHKKLFFFSYGQLWCGDIYAAFRQLQASTDEHVPDKFRVNGPLSNMREFSAEFNCPRGSAMNPEKKCEIY